MLIKKRKENRYANAGINLSLSERRVFDMSNETLLSHFALIQNKVSKTLSSNERRLVQNRVLFKLRKREFSLEEVDEAVNRVREIIKNLLNE